MLNKATLFYAGLNTRTDRLVFSFYCDYLNVGYTVHYSHLTIFTSKAQSGDNAQNQLHHSVISPDVWK